MAKAKTTKRVSGVATVVRRSGPARIIGYVINLFDGDNYYWTGEKFLNKSELARIYTSHKSAMATKAVLSRYLVLRKQLLFVLGRCA